jgi:transcriptional regulator with XRE-family HTH domain
LKAGLWQKPVEWAPVSFHRLPRKRKRASEILSLAKAPKSYWVESLTTKIRFRRSLIFPLLIPGNINLFVEKLNRTVDFHFSVVIMKLKGARKRMTKFGAVLRTIRFNRGEVLKDMADKTGFTSAYISAIEAGDRSITDKFYDSLVSNYTLSETELHQLEESRAETNQAVSLGLANLNEGQKKVAINLQRTLKDMDSDQVTRMLDIMGEKIK